MAKVSAKNAVVIVAGNDLSQDAVSYNIQDNADTVDVTGFTDGVKHYVPGLKNGNITIDFLWNTSTGGAYTILQPLVAASTGSTVSVYPEASGGKRYTGVFFLKGIVVSGTPSDAVKLGSCEFVVSSTASPSWSTSS